MHTIRNNCLPVEVEVNRRPPFTDTKAQICFNLNDGGEKQRREVIAICCDVYAMCARYRHDMLFLQKSRSPTNYDITQAAPLVENVRTRQLRFLCYVLTLPDYEPYKEYAPYIPPYGKRKPGRQRTLFLTFIQYLLEDIDNMIGPDKLSELAQDRCG